MQSDTVSVLRHRRVFASCDPEATRAFMAQKEFYLDVSPREVGAFDFAASALYLPHSYIGCVQYGSAASVRVPEHRKRDDYFMHLPLRGTAAVANWAGEVECAARQAVISSPRGHRLDAQPGSARITLSLTKSAVMNQPPRC